MKVETRTLLLEIEKWIEFCLYHPETIDLAEGISRIHKAAAMAYRSETGESILEVPVDAISVGSGGIESHVESDAMIDNLMPMCCCGGAPCGNCLCCRQRRYMKPPPADGVWVAGYSHVDPPPGYVPVACPKIRYSCGPGLHQTAREAMQCGNHVLNEYDRKPSP